MERKPTRPTLVTGKRRNKTTNSEVNVDKLITPTQDPLFEDLDLDNIATQLVSNLPSGDEVQEVIQETPPLTRDDVIHSKEGVQGGPPSWINDPGLPSSELLGLSVMEPPVNLDQCSLGKDRYHPYKTSDFQKRNRPSQGVYSPHPHESQFLRTNGEEEDRTAVFRQNRQATRHRSRLEEERELLEEPCGLLPYWRETFAKYPVFAQNTIRSVNIHFHS